MARHPRADRGPPLPHGARPSVGVADRRRRVHERRHRDAPSGAGPHLVRADRAADPVEHGGRLPDAAGVVRRAASSSGGVEVRRIERAVASRCRAPRVRLRRRLPPAHDREGAQPRHGMVLDARLGVAARPRQHRTLALGRARHALAARAQRVELASHIPRRVGFEAMSVVSLVGVEKSFGSWALLRGAELDVGDHARIGLVGPNGAGKSTILKIMAGLEEPSGGEVVRRKGLVTAYLEQNPDGDERTADATVLAARPDVAELDAELRAVEVELARPDVAADLGKMERVLARQQSVMDRWVAAGGAGLAGEARSLLASVGIDGSDLALPTTALSGGQRKLVGLASCLMRQPDLLLLDEPETHLDADRREQLEELLASFPGAVVIVSHDRYLLDDSVSQIAELDGGRVTPWPGNYSAFAVAKQIALVRQQQL